MKNLKKPIKEARDYLASLEMRRDQSVSNIKQVLMTSNLNKPNRNRLEKTLKLIEGIKT